MHTVLKQDLIIRAAGRVNINQVKAKTVLDGILADITDALSKGAEVTLILDPPNRAQLIELLLAVKDDFDRILVFATDDFDRILVFATSDFDRILVFATSDHADPSPIPELAVWWIQDGQVAPVTIQQAA